MGWLPIYCVDSVPTMTNTGNVGVTAYFSDDDTPDEWETSMTVAAGDTITVPFPPAGMEVYVELDGDNTIADHNKFQIGNNGNVYFVLNQGCP